MMFSRTFVFGDQVWPIIGQPVFAPQHVKDARKRAFGGYDVAAFATDRLAKPKQAKPAKAGGARRDRTDDLMLAKHALSQLSYGPVTRRRMLTR